ncbi:TPA: thermonuclease family protein [Salmonella enterica]|uniref:Micrococcal nuclease n=1 Tax=Salmonella enterica TaxID=28901 RepID=A0A3F3I9X0_SALER|nr:thermonuclease family protein [Salmonella enterica]EDQ9731871.1 thermonuclease family protein [Salmonella enterica subsp. enterica]EEN8115601.1 thermonuclease family protein [Salmonella enterica subsp. enterica serovar Newport]EAO2755690.1 micrococcal nuclease [Salmonella enterica]EBC6125016.1 micrococcal nuclease [Salmonella enterica]EBD3762616.1 micrococcal nuclease [Salmonella enterica]
MNIQKLISLLIFLCPVIVQAAELNGKVIHVLDGDTIEVLQDNKPVRIRLANIDAPEKKQAYGRWSTSQLKDLLGAQPVTVTCTQTDRYGRIIGRVFTTNGIEANRFMVKSGAAWIYERYNTDPALPGLQVEARLEQRGLWADVNPVPPWEWRHKNHGG